MAELWCLAGADGVANFTELVLVFTEHRVFLRRLVRLLVLACPV
jgi:hypothetical protein